MHETALRVRFDEVDSMGVVHHPRYLIYFEVARTDFMRSLGLAYVDLMRSGTHLAVTEVGVRHLRPGRYDDPLVVLTRCTAVSGTRVELRYEVRRGAELLAEGFTRLASISPEGRPVRMPREVRDRFESVVVE